MRLNEDIAISAPKVLLVPYDAHHVLEYHGWMQDPAIQEATASERLSLEEEYENQLSWRRSQDKLTFIVCRPPADGDGIGDEPATVGDGDGGRVYAGEVDAPERMVGDINLFLTPWENEDDNEDDSGGGGDGKTGDVVAFCSGEVDIMIADLANRGKGMGRTAVSTFLRFIRHHLDGILAEYHGHLQQQQQGSAGSTTTTTTTTQELRLRDLVVKINAGNARSIALFRGLGFRQRGEVNYFGEIRMVLEGFGDGGVVAGEGGTGLEGYRELAYDRSRLQK